MQWDLGLQGLAVLGALSLGLGGFAGLVVGQGVAYRLWATVVTTLLCFGVGVVTSEVLFGWATEEELQPIIDGLARDEVLLTGVLTTAAVVLVMRYLARGAGARDGRSEGTGTGRHRLHHHA
jgi:hypothetical protein